MADELYLPTIDAIAARYRRDYGIRNPAASVQTGTLPYIDSRAFADNVGPLYANGKAIYEAQDLAGKSGVRLERVADDEGLPARLAAVGASGSVAIKTGNSGAYLYAGDELKLGATRYRVTTSGLYTTSSPVPIEGVDTGTGTEAPSGTVLTFTSVRPGLASAEAKVTAAGLTGGRARETDDELRDRIRAHRRHRGAAGNAADYVQAIEERIPGLSVEAAFVYPAIIGPGTVAVVFTMRPGEGDYGSRLPNTTHIAKVTTTLPTLMPEDDTIYVSTLVSSPVDVLLRVAWARNARGWADPQPWPYYHSAGAVRVVSVPPPTATSFVVSTPAPGFVAPAPGNRIAFFDGVTGKFVKKTIASVTGTNPWTITVDTSFGQSDASYIPRVGQPLSPWSESLDTLTESVVGYFHSLGPGEQVVPFDGGLRQRRFPEAPEWPSVVSTRLLSAVFEAPSVQDAVVLEPSLPYATPLGSAGAVSYLLTLGSLSAYPFE